jgi:hypothetical protein
MPTTNGEIDMEVEYPLMMEVQRLRTYYHLLVVCHNLRFQGRTKPSTAVRPLRPAFSAQTRTSRIPRAAH